MASGNSMRHKMDIQRDVNSLFRKLNQLHIRHLDSKARKKILRKAAKPVVKATKAYAPVDSGALKKSIKVLPRMKDPNGVYVGPQYAGRGRKVKNAGNHAHFSEFGTRKWNSPHKGWFRRGVAASKMQAFYILKEQIEKEIRKFKKRYGFQKRA